MEITYNQNNNHSSKFGLLFIIGLIGMIIIGAVAILPTKSSSVNKTISINALPIGLQNEANLAFYGLWDVQTDITHGDVRHAGDAETVRKCLDQNGTFQLYVNPKTGHFVEVCRFSDTMWGWRVVKKVQGIFQEITAFLEDNYNLWEVENYLSNGGYMLIQQ